MTLPALSGATTTKFETYSWGPYSNSRPAGIAQPAGWFGNTETNPVPPVASYAVMFNATAVTPVLGTPATPVTGSDAVAFDATATPWAAGSFAKLTGIKTPGAGTAGVGQL